VKRFFEWLERPFEFSIVRLIECLFLLYILSIGVLILNVENFHTAFEGSPNLIFSILSIPGFLIQILGSYLYGAFLEEIVYRILPLVFLLHCFWSIRCRIKLLTIAALISSVVFGLSHATGWKTAQSSLLLQGALGLCWAFVALKILHAKGRWLENSLRALFVLTLTHFFYNMTLFALVVALN